MSERFDIFADISLRHGAVGYAIAIVPEYGEARLECGGLPCHRTNVAGEIQAIAIAVSQCDDNSIVRVFTDLSDLPSIMGGSKVSYEPVIASNIAALRAACARHDRVEFHIVDPHNDFYRGCHDRARSAAMRLARKSGRFTQKNDTLPAKPRQR